MGESMGESASERRGNAKVSRTRSAESTEATALTQRGFQILKMYASVYGEAAKNARRPTETESGAAQDESEELAAAQAAREAAAKAEVNCCVQLRPHRKHENLLCCSLGV